MDRKKLPLAFGILSINLLAMSGSVVGTAIAAIAKSFPTEPISKVQLISTIPQIGSVIATLIFAWLVYHLTRKDTGMLAILLVGIGGIVPAFWHSSLNAILACMVLLGLGVGLITNIGPILVQEHFDGEERATVMGWQMGFNNIGMMAITFIGGILGAKNWHYLFWAFLISFIIMVIFYFMVPRDKRVKEDISTKSDKPSLWAAFKHINGWIYMILVITFFVSLIITAFMANESIVLSIKGHGTGYTAAITAIGNVGGIITAALLGKIRKFTKAYTMAWGFIAFFIAFICILLPNNFIFHIIGNVFSGVGIVMINATIPFLLSSLADKHSFPVVIAMNTFISSIAGAIAPLILAFIHIPAGDGQYIFGLSASILIGVLLMVFRVGHRIRKSFTN